MPEPELRAPTFAESVAIESYKSALQGALASADGAGDKLATAAASVATAYGAVLALVAPKESTAPLVAAIPFAAFAVALVLALWTQSLGISVQPNDEVDKLRASLECLVTRKRWLNRVALLALGIGLAVAGVIVAERYRPTKSVPSSTHAVVRLTRTGHVEMAHACKLRTSTITGSVKLEDLGDTWVKIEKPMPECRGGHGALVLPPRDVASIRVR